MSRKGKKHDKNNPYNLVIALLLLTAAVFANYIFDAGFVKIFLYVTGSLYSLIYIKINSIGYRYNCDYIQSGEASIALLTITALLIWFSGSLTILIPVVILVIFLSDIFFNRVLIKKGSEAFAAGIYINVFAALLIAFTLFKIPGFNRDLIGKVLLGYITSLNFPPLYLIIPAVLVLIAAFLYLSIKPELLLFSHGPGFFRSAGMNYRILRRIVTLFRSIVFTAAFLLAGIAGGTALYYHRPGRGIRYQLEFSMMTLAYTQMVLLLSLFYGKITASAVSVAASYIIYLLLMRRRIYLYDRN